MLNNSNKNSEIRLWNIIIGISGILFITLILHYASQFGWKFSSTQQDFGNYGSYVGGILGAIFSFFTIIILIRTLTIQSNQLKMQEENSKINIEKLNEQLITTTNYYKKNLKAQRKLLEIEKDNNIKNIGLMWEQLRFAKEHNDKTLIYEIIKDKISQINELMMSEISIDDLYRLYTENDSIKDILQLSGKVNNYEKFKAAFNNNETLIVINLLNLIYESKVNYLNLKVPHNIEYKIKNISSYMVSLARIISEYNNHEISHTILLALLKQLLLVNRILYYTKIYSFYKHDEIHKFFAIIENEKYRRDLFEVNMHNYTEVKRKIFDYLLKNNMIPNLSFTDFCTIYKIEETYKDGTYKVTDNLKNSHKIELYTIKEIEKMKTLKTDRD